MTWSNHLQYVSLQINAILDASPVWREYKDQRHDLFISDTQIAGYLTGAHYCLSYFSIDVPICKKLKMQGESFQD